MYFDALKYGLKSIDVCCKCFAMHLALSAVSLSFRASIMIRFTSQ